MLSLGSGELINRFSKESGIALRSSEKDTLAKGIKQDFEQQYKEEVDTAEMKDLSAHFDEFASSWYGVTMHWPLQVLRKLFGMMNKIINDYRIFV